MVWCGLVRPGMVGAFLGAVWAGGTVFGLASGVTAEEPGRRKPVSPRRSEAPTQLVITGDKPPAPAPTTVLPARPPGRLPMATDANGNLRRADEPRFVTGSFIKQKIELYGNQTNASVPLSVYSQGDLRKGTGLLGPIGTAGYGQSYSDMEFVRRAEARRALPPTPAVHVVDLRRVPPTKRRAALIKFLGRGRARQVLADPLNQSPGTGRKPKLAR